MVMKKGVRVGIFHRVRGYGNVDAPKITYTNEGLLPACGSIGNGDRQQDLSTPTWTR
jgi:hypothetical protein